MPGELASSLAVGRASSVDHHSCYSPTRSPAGGAASASLGLWKHVGERDGGGVEMLP